MYSPLLYYCSYYFSRGCSRLRSISLILLKGWLIVCMTAMINYSWSQSPALLEQPLNKAIAALMTGIVWASSGWYLRRGVLGNGIVVALMGGLQAWAAFSSSSVLSSGGLV